MRVHEVMRCGHVQEWPPGQRVQGRLGMPWELWVCSLTWFVSETPSSVTENRISLAVNQKREVSRSFKVSRSIRGQSQPWLLFSHEVGRAVC